jgi:carbon-monoxide dehydrogenase large subunit
MSGPEATHVGRRALRIEDDALLRGRGKYLDDVQLGCEVLHAAFVRSSQAHAKILGIDKSQAEALDGVVGVYTATDLAALLKQPRLPLAFPKVRQLEPQVLETFMPWVLATDEACHVGEAIAVVVATSRYAAEDAADAVYVDYEPLDAVVHAESALAADAARAVSATASNVFTNILVEFGDCDGAFSRAAYVHSERIFQQRGVAHPIEGRGIMARPDPATGTLMVWASTQTAHELRNTIAEMLDLGNDQIRVITPDLGGGFGCKFMVYPEDIVVPALARHLGRAVKWTEDRREHFVSAIQEREQHWSVEVAFSDDGLLLGLRGHMVHDQGAFAPHYITVPFNGAAGVPGPYLLPSYRMRVDVVRTNKPAVIPVRGAGFPQGTFVMERMLDRIAARTGIDRAEVRRRNLIPRESLPYSNGVTTRSGAKVSYDSGDYRALQEAALQKFGYADFPGRQAAARAQGRYIGVGFSHGLKSGGRGPFESATVRVHANGRVSAYTGANAMGQGIQTALCQICADALGVDMDRIEVICGDTGFIPVGLGSYGSRQTMLAGSAVREAASRVRAKALEVARQLLGGDEELTLQAGVVRTKSGAGASLPIGEIARQLAGIAGYAFPKGVSPGLEETSHFRSDSMSYANNFHLCEAEVDIFTGHIRLNRYLAFHDCGNLVNPMIVEGQIQGAIVHGIGNTLFEQMLYDSNGQPLTVTCADYILPTATEVPPIEIGFHSSPTSLNPLGAKGVGENGIISVAPTVISAIEDALGCFGIEVSDTPITPIRLLQLLQGSDKYRDHCSGFVIPPTAP